MVKNSILVIACIASLGFLGCSQNTEESSTGPTLIPITLQTDWYAQPEHGGFYQALAKGYYEAAGFDVTIIQGSPTDINPQKVATRKVDFAISRIDDVIAATDKGMPLMAVGAYMQRTPLALLLHAENPVSSFSELDGKTVKAQPGALFLGFIMNQYKVQPQIVPHDFGMTQFVTDATKSLIQQCYMTSEPYYMQQQGIPVKTIGLSEGGYKTFRVLYTNKDFFEQSPEQVGKFLKASWRGWMDYLAGDPSPAHERIAALNPKMTDDFMTWTRKTLIEKQLVSGDPAKGEYMNKMDPERIDAMMQLLLDLEMIDQKHPHSTFVTWDYTPE